MADGSSQEIPLRGNPPMNVSSSNIVHPINPGSSLRPMPGRTPRASVSFTETMHIKKWVPWLIPLFALINVAMFVVTMYVNNCPKYSLVCVVPSLRRFSFQPLKENPLLGPSSRTLDKMGALVVDKIVHRHQGWRLFSCMWLHGGVIHVLANMISLLIIGIRLEREFGFVKVGLVYIISGTGGSLFSALFLRSNISVGASGALFGLLGALLSELIINWSIYTNKGSSFIVLMLLIVINLGVGLLPNVDNFAHIGGFISGFFLGFVFLIRPQFGWVSQKYMPYQIGSAKPKYKKYQYTLWVISLVVLIGGFAIGFIILFRGLDANRYCSWCRYLDCVPTSRWSCNSENGYCMYNEVGNQLYLTCSTNGKSKIYSMSNITESQVQGLCSKLCN